LNSGTQLYISWWWNSDNSTDEQGKFLRLSNSADITEQTFSWGNQGQYIWYNGAYCICSGCSGAGTLWSDTIVSANTWHFMEAYFDSSARTWDVRVDNVSHGSTANYNCGFAPNYVWKVGVDSGGNSPQAQTSYIDDIYIDNTFQHVVIGNASTYSASTHFEMQPPTVWNSNGQSIAVTLNQGSFNNSDPAFLYVIDQDGIVSDYNLTTPGAQGYPITFGSGGGGDTTPPATPSGLSVN
jgi:hypothetical protein